MIEKTFKGHKLSNSMSAIAFHYPRISGGKDLVTDVLNVSPKLPENSEDGIDIKDLNPGFFPTMLLCYAAFRMAGDEEACKKKTDELINEVNLFNPNEVNEFCEVMMSLLSETSKKG